MLKIVSLVTLFLLLGFAGFAQGAFSMATQEETVETTRISLSDKAIDSSVFMDAEAKTCYVDLERLPMNLKQAVLINNEGQEVLVMSLTDVPVDSIVELDYSELPSGSYLLELRSYTSKAHKALQL